MEKGPDLPTSTASNKKLLVAKGIATRSKDATGRTTSSNKNASLLGPKKSLRNAALETLRKSHGSASR